LQMMDLFILFIDRLNIRINLSFVSVFDLNKLHFHLLDSG
jgi:hypothetical protein